MFNRLEKIIETLRGMHRPEPNVIFVQLWNGETREQAKKKYEIATNLKRLNDYECIFISIPSDEQIRKRNK